MLLHVLIIKKFRDIIEKHINVRIIKYLLETHVIMIHLLFNYFKLNYFEKSLNYREL